MSGNGARLRNPPAVGGIGNAGLTSAHNIVPQQLDLPTVMADLSAATNRSIELAKEINARFAPVLSQREQDQAPAAKMKANYSSPLAQAIDEQVGTLHAVIMLYEDLLSRAQL